MSKEGNIVKLWFNKAKPNPDPSIKNEFTWDLFFTIKPKQPNKIKIDQVALPFSWLLFNNEKLNYDIGGPVIVGTLNGSFALTDLPIALAAASCLNATSCSISTSTRLISLMFGVATTLRISEWSERARYFLGAGNSNLTGTTIVFPFPCDLGGDLEINMKLPVTNTNLIDIVGDDSVPDHKIPIPVDCNPYGFFYYSPDGYFLSTSPDMLDTGITVSLTDQWDGPIDLRGRNGYIQFRYYNS